MIVTFRNHPARAKHPLTGETLTSEDGKPIPLFPEMRAIYLDEIMIGYCGDQPDKPISLIVHLPVEVCEVIEQAVADEFGDATSLNMPAIITETLAVEEDVDE